MSPDNQRAFYECGNPDYASVSPVDGKKTFFSCDDMRSGACGIDASGFLPIVPEIPPGGVRLYRVPRWYERLWAYWRGPFS
jgi:hypothetical protein